MLTSTTHDEIKFACRTYHYAHCIPSVSYGYNVFNERYEWCGVILFGTGATPNIGKPFGMEQSEVVELVRVALNGLQPCTSECVAAALKQLHEDAPQIKIVVSYADADQNHYGTIYQATNWIYLGMKEQNALGAFIINGKKVHRRTIGSAGGGGKTSNGCGKTSTRTHRNFGQKGNGNTSMCSTENCGRNGNHRRNRTRNEKMIHFDRRLIHFFEPSVI